MAGAMGGAMTGTGSHDDAGGGAPAERLWRSLEETARFGGTPDGGLHRLAASEQDGRARDWLVGELRALGASVRVDAVGNVFGWLPASDAPGSAEPASDAPAGRGDLDGPTPGAVLLGSHLDSQPYAGRYDGVYGVLAGLETLRVRADEPRRRPLALACWTNEEGARFAPSMMGSSVFAGRMAPGDALATRDADGITLADALARIGYAGTDVVRPEEFAAYVEIHIEQGPILESTGTDVAVVTGVQGMCWLRVHVRGRRAHAGTTPMESRQDAMAAAARCVLAVEESGRARPQGRATVGVLEVANASPNVVPDDVALTVELRHPTQTAQMLGEVRDAIARIGGETGCRIDSELTFEAPPVQFDERVLDVLRASAASVAGEPIELGSGAGHDAGPVSAVVPAGMLFVPCRGGVSHSPAERIERSWSDHGLAALLDSARRLDRRAS